MSTEACPHCGGATGPVDEAQERLVLAAISYALATRPNGHPVDSDFRRAVYEFTRWHADDIAEDSAGIDGPTS